MIGSDTLGNIFSNKTMMYLKIITGVLLIITPTSCSYFFINSYGGLDVSEGKIAFLLTVLGAGVFICMGLYHIITGTIIYKLLKYNDAEESVIEMVCEKYTNYLFLSFVLLVPITWFLAITIF